MRHRCYMTNVLTEDSREEPSDIIRQQQNNNSELFTRLGRSPSVISPRFIHEQALRPRHPSLPPPRRPKHYPPRFPEQ